MNPTINIFKRLMSLLVATALAGCELTLGDKPAPIKVAVLHSLTGTMASSERPVANATLLAIEEINAQGGVSGRRIESLLVDSQSDPARAASEAERLIRDEGVVAIFGCWTSACRKAVLPVVEQHQSLLVYPLQYEGLERSAHIFYTGLVPNQQVLPSLSWVAGNLGRRVYLLGSDYVYPRTANLIIRQYAAALGLEIVGERYLPLGTREFGHVVREIDQLAPDAVINTVNGDSNVAFFQALAALRGPGAARTKVLSLSVTEAEVAQAPAEMQGHYAAWSYFQSLDLPAGRQFVADYRRRFGGDQLIGDPMVAAHTGVRLWAQAATRHSNAQADSVIRALARQSIDSALGVVAVDPDNHHLWRQLRIGQARPDGQFTVVWSSTSPLRPRPYPLLHTKKVWESLQAGTMRQLGN